MRGPIRDILPLLFIGALAVLSTLSALLPGGLPGLSHSLTALLGGVAWICAGVLVWLRIRLRNLSRALAEEVGSTPTSATTLEREFQRILGEISRKNSALSLNVIENKITTKDELSKALERIVTNAFKLLGAESAELALFDRSSGAYHASFVLGKPFRTSAQAMLSGAADSGVQPDYSPDVIVRPIAFAGNVLGSLRVALKKGRLPSASDQEIMRLLALQSSIALINGEFVTELLKMKQASDDTVKAKTGFLANLSHELRGPIGIMLNAVELVLDELCGPVTEDQKETLRMVSQNGHHLLELVNDVLDYAKVEAGRITVSKIDIPLDDLLKDIGGVIRGQAEAKRHKVVIRSASEALLFPCDRRHARQMLINIFTNAIKYTPDGGTIEAWFERIPGNKVKISVKDTGVGIEAADRGKVFAAFERVENAYSMKQMGTGLGMPLTKRLAEVNGGTLDFSSVPGQGSHFWLIFPVSESGQGKVADHTSEVKVVNGAGKGILIVAENDGERGMVTRYLSHVGFVITLADSLNQAVDVVSKSKFDLVIVDDNVIDNLKGEVVDNLRVAAKAPALPVVLISSRAFEFDIKKQLRLGVDRYLTKPIQLDELGKIVQEIIESEARIVEKAKGTEKPQAKPLTAPGKHTFH